MGSLPMARWRRYVPHPQTRLNIWCASRVSFASLGSGGRYHLGFELRGGRPLQIITRSRSPPRPRPWVLQRLPPRPSRGKGPGPGPRPRRPPRPRADDPHLSGSQAPREAPFGPCAPPQLPHIRSPSQEINQPRRQACPYFRTSAIPLYLGGQAWLFHGHLSSLKLRDAGGGARFGVRGERPAHPGGCVGVPRTRGARLSGGTTRNTLGMAGQANYFLSRCPGVRSSPAHPSPGYPPQPPTPLDPNYNPN